MAEGTTTAICGSILRHDPSLASSRFSVIRGSVFAGAMMASSKNTVDKAEAKRSLKNMGLEATDTNVAVYASLKGLHLRVSKKMMTEHLDRRVMCAPMSRHSS